MAAASTEKLIFVPIPTVTILSVISNKCFEIITLNTNTAIEVNILTECDLTTTEKSLLYKTGKRVPTSTTAKVARTIVIISWESSLFNMYFINSDVLIFFRGKGS